MLLRAISVGHRHATRAQSASLIISAVVAALSILTRIVPSATSTVVLIGALWAGAYTVLVIPWAGRYQRMSAVLQEMFDVDILGLPWNHVAAGDPVPDDEISRLSRRFHGNEDQLRDYYLVADVGYPYDVAFCLEQNLAWGSRVRRRYADLLVTLALLWCAVCVTVGVLAGLSFAALVSNWFVPSLGLLLLCLDIYRAQVSATGERTRVLHLLRAGTDRGGYAPDLAWATFARQVQDVLFSMRKQQPRVPTWFFRRLHDTDMHDFRVRMRALEVTVGRAVPPAA